MKTGWLAAAAGMALTACAGSGGSSNQPKSETQRAQSQAQDAFQRAAEAQKRANEEQAKAEQSHQEVERLQKQLAEAQARAQAQDLKAQQAQQEARRLAQEAQQQATQAQAQATQLQRSESQTRQQIHQQNMQQWTQTKDVQGMALGTEGDAIRVRSPDQGDLRLKVNDSTAVVVDGRTGSPTQIQPGSEVRASYQMIDGQPTAVKVEVTSKNKPARTGSSGSTSGTTSSPSGTSDQPQQR
jgi:hypothetical protein